jgi:predicted amidophosphoribosyltransferase
MTSPWAWVKELFGGAPECPECHTAVRKAQAHCTQCGYALVEQSKATGARGPV